MAEISKIIRQHNIHFFYTLTHGAAEDIYHFENKYIWGPCKTIQHCIFETKAPKDAQADFYISISDFLNRKNGTNVPVIPHIVYMPECSEDLREELGIPKEAIVLGRHGGACQFDIPFVHNAIKNLLNEDPNIYFLFLNTNVFYEHPRIIYLPPTLDDIYKAKFINTCSAMIHARIMGETFGLSVAEFSIMNKPVITGYCGDLEHLMILKKNAIIYNTEERLMEIFRGIREILKISKYWNSYARFAPGNIIRMFDRMIFSDEKDKLPMGQRLHPISFSIAQEKIVKEIPAKTKAISSIIPGKPETYIFNTEEDYYNEYKSSVFAITTMKAGWDCMRHYEILACGCIPYFPRIEECPANTMVFLPKDLILEGNRLYEKYASNEYTHINMEECEDLIQRLLTYTREKLTTVATAKYLLNTVDADYQGKPLKILFLNGYDYPDYLRDLTVHGLKEILGSDCHDHPSISFIYKSYDKDISKLYGKGMTYTKLLDDNMRNPALDDTIRKDIAQNNYDFVIYGNMHRGMPFYPIISELFSPEKIIMFCGNDIHDCNHEDYTSVGHHVFVRELA
jgi:hypothetical protein